jgi:hypothetical protein
MNSGLLALLSEALNLRNSDPSPMVLAFEGGKVRSMVCLTCDHNIMFAKPSGILVSQPQWTINSHVILEREHSLESCD